MSRTSHQWWYRLLPLVPLGAILAVWQMFALGVHQKWAMPTAGATAVALAHLLVSAKLWSALGQTGVGMMIGFAVSVAVGLPLGLLLGAFPSVERFVDIYLTFFLVAPVAALVPLVILIFGIGTAGAAAVVFVFAMVYIAANTIVGVRTTSRSLREMARSFGASPWQTYRRIVLPSATPAIMAGLRNGLGHAVTGIILAEFEIVSIGLGALVDLYSAHFETAHLFAVVVVLLVLGGGLLAALQLLERRLLSWRQA